MFRLIIRTTMGFKTFDFECVGMDQDLGAVHGELVGIEVIPANGVARRTVLLAIGEQKIPVIKAVRQHTGYGLKEAKELVDSVPIELPEIPPADMAALIDDLRKAGATVR